VKRNRKGWRTKIALRTLKKQAAGGFDIAAWIAPAG
jgi:hypothetical protein